MSVAMTPARPTSPAASDVTSSLLTNGEADANSEVRAIELETMSQKADWEEQFASLNMRGTEIHQTQLKLIREQTATFIRDLGIFRTELDMVKRAQAELEHWFDRTCGKSTESNSSIVEQITFLEGSVSLHAEKHSRHDSSLQELMQHRASVAERLDDVERMLGGSTDKHWRELQDLKSTAGSIADKQGRHDSSLQELLKHRTSVAEQLGDLERQLGSSTDKHLRELQDLKCAHDRHAEDVDRLKLTVSAHAALPNRIDELSSSLRKQAQDMQNLQSSSENHARCLMDVKNDRAGLEERLGSIDMLLLDVGKHARELDSLRDAHGKLSSASSKQARDLEGFRELHAQHSAEFARLDALESLVAERSEKQNWELQVLKDTHARHAKDLTSIKASQFQQAALGERVGSLEALVDEASNKHAEAVAAFKVAHANHEDALSRHAREVANGMAKQAGLTERLPRDVLALRDSLDKHSEDLSDANDRQVVLEERLKYVETLCNNLDDKHARELRGLRAAHEKHANDLAGVKVDCESLAGLIERTEGMEKLLDDMSSRHLADSKEVRDVHAKLAAAVGRCEGDVEGLRELHAQHGQTASRLETLKRSLVDSTESHGAELEALRSAQASHADAFGRHAKEVGSALAKHSGLMERIPDELEALRDSHGRHEKELEEANGRHLAVQERMRQLDKILGDANDKHAREVKGLKAAQDKQCIEMVGIKMECAQAVASLERVDALEKLSADSGGKHVADMQGLKEAHSRSAAALGRCESALEGLDALHAKHAAAAERLDALESSLGEVTSKHRGDLQALQVAHSKHEGAFAKHVSDLGVALGEQIALVERLPEDLRVLRDCQEKHGQELHRLRDAHAKYVTFFGRYDFDANSMRALHLQYAATDRRLGSLEKSSRAPQASQPNGRGSMLEERINAVEAMVGDAAGKNGKELRSLRLSHDKQFTDMTVIRAEVAVLASMPERVEHLEAVVDGLSGGSPADSQISRSLRSDIDALKASGVQFTATCERLSLLEQLLEQLFGDRDFWASLPKRLDHLEQLLGDRDFVASLPKRLALLEQGAREPAAAPAPAPAPVQRDRRAEELERLKTLQASTAHHIASINERRHVYFDFRTGKAAFLITLAFRKRYFGSDHVEEPTAEWEDIVAVQPLLCDIAFLYEVLLTAAQDYQPGAGVTLTVVRCRNRHTKTATTMVRQSSTNVLRQSSSKLLDRRNSPSPTRTDDAAAAERAQAWQRQLARNRAQLIVESLIDQGIPQACLVPQVEEGTQDGYYVHYNLGPASAILGSS